MIRTAVEADPRASLLARSEKPMLVVAATIAGAVSMFWLLPSLADLAPAGWSQMSPLTAAGLPFAAISLALCAPGASATAQTAERISTLVLIGLGLAVLLLEGNTLNFQFDETIRALPAPQTAASVLLLGLCLLAMRMRSLPLLVADLSAILLWGLVLFMAGGHVFHAVSLIGVDDGRLMAPHTLVAIVALLFVVTSRLSKLGGWFSILAGAGYGSRIARYLGLPIIMTPFVMFTIIGYVIESETLSIANARALFAPVFVLMALSVVGWMGHRINRLEHSLRTQSVTDELTKTHNSRGFSSVSEYVVQAASRSKTDLIVFFFDLDDLKRVNDTVGHEAGSRLIKRFSELIVSNFRKSDVVARIGGDEFAVLALGCNEKAKELLSRLDHTVALANQSAPGEVAISYSAGFAIMKPDGKCTLDDAIARADANMYEQKRGKRSGGDEPFAAATHQHRPLLA